MTFYSVDLFSGIGGLSWGLSKANFKVIASVENDQNAILGYSLNHPSTKIFDKDIELVDPQEIRNLLNGNPLHLLAGCPPCQGFSSIRKLNKKHSVRDKRNRLILEYLRFVKELDPLTIMFENVPGVKNYYLFGQMVRELRKLGYRIDFDIVNVRDYSVPQNRKRLILVGSKLGDLHIDKGNYPSITVRDTISNMPDVKETEDEAHKIFTKHGSRILEMIKKIPKDGGSREDVPEYTLDCHKKENVGFKDVYGRLRWDDFSSTITGGCLNASKGRFLHPEENRCITAREAALLQSFPIDYKIPTDVPKYKIAQLIGNALPPKFSLIQAKNIKNHLLKYC